MNTGDPQVVGLVPVLIVVGVIVLLLFGVLALLSRFYRQVDQGRALVVNTMRSEPVVAFTGAIVYPVINRAEIMDLSVKTIDIDRRGKEGLICNDNIRADINVTFFVRVNKTVDDVLKVAQSVGCQRASDPEALSELFSAKFAEALKTVGKHFNFEELYTKRDAFKDKIIEVIGKDLNGFILDDAAIDYLEQTPLEALDKDNIMDADGIRKITDLTVIQNLKTNELRQKERMETGSQNLTADEAVFRFEQRRAEAEAKKNKEVAVSQARESNEALRVASEEQKKTLLITTKNEEEAQIAGQNKERGVAIAQKAREREIAVETERVEKARALEAISREREVALVGIARDKEVELQKKEIANVIRDRIAVEKSVAAEEEQIKDLRNSSEATRKKEAVRIAAEAAAQEVLVKQVKAAEASEEAAKYKARERVLLADSELDTADKTARAKIRIAEGVQAESAAEGLAKVRVREADAAAIEKQGLVEAKVTREKLVAEAAGLAQKAESMKLLDGAGRGHEEFRLRLDKDKSVELEKIRARKEVVAAQAQILAQAMGNARVNIVGGDGQFLERFMNAISLGQSVDGALEQSETLRELVQSLMSGNGASGGLAEALDKLAPLVTQVGNKDIVVEEVQKPRPR
ncbi:MAG TPA: hypothetical protein VER11_12530 [Polyangiaceae bacterium]|nr:hypothetical protein [Polyangiaceae bacterium]